MEDTVDKVAERLARFEETVAKGFFDSGLQFSARPSQSDKSTPPIAAR
jgi:hypothetical protein